MKRRLHQPALPQVRRAFAGQQALAEQTPRALETASLQEIALVGDQHVFDEMRMIEQEQMLARHVHVRDVAVGAREVAEEGERIAARPVDDERAKRSRRAGRVRDRWHQARSSSNAEETAPGCSRGRKWPAFATTRCATSFTNTAFSAGDASAAGRPRPSSWP